MLAGDTRWEVKPEADKQLSHRFLLIDFWCRLIREAHELRSERPRLEPRSTSLWVIGPNGCPNVLHWGWKGCRIKKKKQQDEWKVTRAAKRDETPDVRAAVAGWKTNIWLQTDNYSKVGSTAPDGALWIFDIKCPSASSAAAAGQENNVRSVCKAHSRAAAALLSWGNPH